jgi:hypothetical protein
VVAGLYAGQVVTGGLSAGSHLTLRANAGDGVGPRTGFVQFDDDVRPAVDAQFVLGNASYRFKSAYFSDSVSIGATLVLAPGSITDTSGAISFDNENLTTTGNLTGAIVKGTTSLVADVGGQQITLTPGSIANTTGTISFGANNLSSSGTLGSGTITVSSDMVIATGSITSVSGNITFDNENLLTSGTLGAGNTTVTRLDSDNIRIDGNTISVLNANGNLILQSNGTGIIDLQNNATTLGITATGTVGVTGQINIDNLRLDGNVISSTNLNGNITLTPNGTGSVETSSKIIPSADGTLDLGATGSRFNDLFMGGAISDGTTSIAQSVLQSFRDINVAVAAGMTLFWTGTKWQPSAPDSEVDHGTISGLSDDDHTQYMLLAGRAGGQALVGGTAASEDLTFESTSHATKGSVKTKDNLVPFTK